MRIVTLKCDKFTIKTGKVRIFILFLNAEKVWPIVNYRLKTQVSGRCMMYVRVVHFCLMADGQKFKTKNLRVVLICYWQNQSKVWNKMQEDRQDCTVFIFIEIREKHIIQTSVVLSVCEMLFHAFSLSTTQGRRPEDSSAWKLIFSASTRCNNFEPTPLCSLYYHKTQVICLKWRCLDFLVFDQALYICFSNLHYTWWDHNILSYFWLFKVP